MTLKEIVRYFLKESIENAIYNQLAYKMQDYDVKRDWVLNDILECIMNIK